VHLTSRGVDAVTTFIAGTVERVLAGEDVSPAAAPWTVLVPGAEGDVVEKVQDALIATGVDVPGGADGVYGNDTMAAVAAYQRQTEGLQVTGAVDMATARALGLIEDPDAVDEAAPTTASPAPTTVAVTAPVPAQDAAVGESRESTESDGGGLSRWLIVTALTVVALVAAVVGRRRYVVAQRAARRRARVHPATSPRRSVADLRRTGELPAVGAIGGARVIYDQEVDEPV
jgi:peptidoglycan hydrolase-like protein with peptidoglycan-binding domain